MTRIASLAIAAALVAASSSQPARAAGDACLDRLDELAQVRYIPADDSIPGPLTRSEMCRYEPKWHHTYTYTTACHGDSMDVTITPTAVLDVGRHTFIRLPAPGPDSAATWRKLRHWQHDRVAITQDERPVLLAQWLVAHMPPLRARTACGAKVQGPFADRVIGEAVLARFSAVVEFVRGRNDAFAEATHQGSTPIRDRDAFFADLYDRGALERAGFPYLAEAGPLLPTPRYQNALRPRCDGKP